MVDEVDPESIVNTCDLIRDLLTDISDELILQKAILNDIKDNTGT